ncbi:hypothetical protein ED28_17325 [[Pantoea] beijingensis]|uniref:Colicin transporter n=2 Tax=[Pantoea] beijingensis TaxID=1324864 RepID=A0A443I999_9GAMM|nr:hypothetical protein ED28_17325 [[Pantoea] beijingensis]
MLRYGFSLMAALSALLLSACQIPGGKPQANLPDRDRVTENCPGKMAGDNALCSYFHEMQWRLQTNFIGADRYYGRECLITAEYRQGRYNVLRTQGDEALCLKAWSVVGTTKGLPPPPEKLPHTLSFWFKPGKK